MIRDGQIIFSEILSAFVNIFNDEYTLILLILIFWIGTMQLNNFPKNHHQMFMKICIKYNHR